MSRVGEKFAEVQAHGRAALIPFLTAGDPNLDTTRALVQEMVERGADGVELGIPFSDPMADGPTLQRSASRALRAGSNLVGVLQLVRELRRDTSVPLVLFGYYNPFFRYGVERLAADAAEAGVDGILCVDLPPEEAGELRVWTDRYGLDLIFLLAPTSTPSRIHTVLRQARGFVYFVSVTGVTGTRPELPHDLIHKVREVKAASDVPVGVGFGIAGPEQAAWVASFADAVIVGSAIAEIIEENIGQSHLRSRVGEFVHRLSSAVASQKKTEREWRSPG